MDQQTSPRSPHSTDRKAGASRESEQLTPELENIAFFSGVVLHITSKVGGLSYEIAWRHIAMLPGGFLRLYEVKKPQLLRGEVDMKNALIELPHESKFKKYDKIKLPPPLSKDTIIEGERSYIYIRSAVKSGKSKVAEMVSKSSGTTIFCVSSTRLDYWLENLKRGAKLGPIDQARLGAGGTVEGGAANNSANNSNNNKDKDNGSGHVKERSEGGGGKAPMSSSSSSSSLFEIFPEGSNASSNTSANASNSNSASTSNSSGSAPSTASGAAQRSPAEIFNSLAKARNAPPAGTSASASLDPNSNLSPNSASTTKATWGAAPSTGPRPLSSAPLFQGPRPQNVQATTVAELDMAMTLTSTLSSTSTTLSSTLSSSSSSSGVSASLAASPFDSPFAADLTVSPFDVDFDDSLSALASVPSPRGGPGGGAPAKKEVALATPFEEFSPFAFVRALSPLPWESTFLLHLHHASQAQASASSSSVDLNVRATPFYLEDPWPNPLPPPLPDSVFVDFGSSFE